MLFQYSEKFLRQKRVYEFGLKPEQNYYLQQMIQKSQKQNSQKKFNEDKQEITCFEDFKISYDLLRGIYDYGFEKPSVIQKLSINQIISGRDLIAQSCSGTGKSASYIIGSLQRIDQQSEKLQTIILTPTRELTMSIYSVIKNLCQFTKIRTECVIGGMNPRQSRQKINDNSPHLIVATPGRCLDFIQKKVIKTDYLKTIVLDEADQMLSRGFCQQVRDIFMNLPADSQCCLFSATMPKDVIELTQKFMKDPKKILLELHQVPVSAIKQFSVCMQTQNQKFPTMVQIYKNISVAQSIIFANTKQKVNEIANKLKQLKFQVSVIHSDVENRMEALSEFKRGATRILVSTDLTGRGIDISQVSLVINYDLPQSHHPLEQYVHRIGRCGRFGKKGVSISLVTPGDASLLVQIQEHYKIIIPQLPLDVSKVYE